MSGAGHVLTELPRYLAAHVELTLAALVIALIVRRGPVIAPFAPPGEDTAKNLRFRSPSFTISRNGEYVSSHGEPAWHLERQGAFFGPPFGV